MQPELKQYISQFHIISAAENTLDFPLLYYPHSPPASSISFSLFKRHHKQLLQDLRFPPTLFWGGLCVIITHVDAVWNVTKTPLKVLS